MGLSSALKRAAGLTLTLALGAGAGSVRAAEREDFPSVRPATREQAVAVLSGGGAGLSSLTPLILSNWQGADAPPAIRRALGVLARAETLPRERRASLPDGSVLRYTTSRGSFDRIDGTDLDRDGRPDLLQVAAVAFADAQQLLVGQLGLTPPDPLDVLLVRVGRELDGYLVPATAPSGRTRIVLEASEGIASDAGLRRAAIRQYAFAVALATGPAMPPAWAEALATWSAMRLTGGPHAETARLLSERLTRFAEGLETESLDLAAGNALWLAFLDEAYGPSAVRLTVEELAAGAPARAALDDGLRRGAGTSLPSALRDFQLWGVLVGDRSDRRHFSFAERLEPPQFPTEAEGLPALAVQTAPPVAPLGGTLVRLRPDAAEGGLRVYFEGEFTTTWEVDLLLVGTRGTLRRLPLPVGPEGRGEVTVPLRGMAETLLLIRNLGPDADPRRFSWAADLERGYPYELNALDATGRRGGTAGTLISWETRSERNLVGFNVLRYPDGGGSPVRVNPVWIPAVGGESELTSYQFLDTGADPGRTHVYRIQGITLEGLPSLSDPVLSR